MNCEISFTCECWTCKNLYPSNAELRRSQNQILISLPLKSFTLKFKKKIGGRGFNRVTQWFVNSQIMAWKTYVCYQRALLLLYIDKDFFKNKKRGVRHYCQSHAPRTVCHVKFFIIILSIFFAFFKEKGGWVRDYGSRQVTDP